jgi:hypothetical protein
MSCTRWYENLARPGLWRGSGLVTARFYPVVSSLLSVIHQHGLFVIRVIVGKQFLGSLDYPHEQKGTSEYSTDSMKLQNLLAVF